MSRTIEIRDTSTLEVVSRVPFDEPVRRFALDWDRGYVVGWTTNGKGLIGRSIVDASMPPRIYAWQLGKPIAGFNTGSSADKLARLYSPDGSAFYFTTMGQQIMRFRTDASAVEWCPYLNPPVREFHYSLGGGYVVAMHGPKSRTPQIVLEVRSLPSFDDGWVRTQVLDEERSTQQQSDGEAIVSDDGNVACARSVHMGFMNGPIMEGITTLNWFHRDGTCASHRLSRGQFSGGQFSRDCNLWLGKSSPEFVLYETWSGRELGSANLSGDSKGGVPLGNMADDNLTRLAYLIGYRRTEYEIRIFDIERL